jgi:hypothetical protein
MGVYVINTKTSMMPDKRGGGMSQISVDVPNICDF